MASSIPFTPLGKKTKFLESEEEKGEAISEAADILAPFVPMTSTHLAGHLAHLVNDLRVEYAGESVDHTGVG